MSLNSKLQLKIDEQITSVVRPSQWKYVFGYFFIGAILFANSFFTFWFLEKGKEGRIFYSVIWLLGLYLLFLVWHRSRSNYFVLTTERIFDINRPGLFKEVIGSMDFSDIDDVVIEKRGIGAAIFNYGSLTIHPKTGKYLFEIENVPRPHLYLNLLNEKKISPREMKGSPFEKVIKLVPELNEAQLTMLYQKVHSQLLNLAGRVSENQD